jgi:hypothetical protein
VQPTTDRLVQQLPMPERENMSCKNSNICSLLTYLQFLHGKYSSVKLLYGYS